MWQLSFDTNFYLDPQKSLLLAASQIFVNIAERQPNIFGNSR